MARLWSGTTNGVDLIYVYDSLGRLVSAKDHGVGTVAYGFDRVGNLEYIHYRNGVTNLYQYDARNRLTNLVWKSGATPLASFAYRLGPTGTRTNLSEVVQGTGRNYAWSYDRLSRLTQETISGATTAALGYGYDPVGNRTNCNSTLSQLPSTTSTYSANDWLESDRYDPNGNTTSSGASSYEYDAENRLTNVNNGAVILLYDGDGNRVSKTVGGVTTYYLVDERNPSGYAQVLEEYQCQGSQGMNANLVLKHIYNYGLDLISDAASVADCLFLTNYFVKDGHGSTRLLVGTGGAIANAFTFDAYGNLIASNAAPQTAYLYCGEQFDPDLGFYYLRARYYKPEMGRFWTMDSYEGDNQDPRSLHKYLYCYGDPGDRFDPSGHESLVGVSIASTISGSLEALYNGVVSGAGSAMQFTLRGVQAGQAADSILKDFILDETGIQAGIDVYDTIRSWITSHGGSPDLADAAVFYQHFDFAVLPLLVDDPDYVATDLDQQEPQCFVAGTLVLTDQGLKTIESVKVGDSIWAFDLATSNRVLKPVLKSFIRERRGWVRVGVDDKSVEVTAEHPFFVLGKGWMPAGNLQAGDRLLTFDPTIDARISWTKRMPGAVTVYNFEVQDLHDYFITDEGILVHNVSLAFMHFVPRALGSRLPYACRILRQAKALTAVAHTALHKALNAHLDKIVKNGITMMPRKGQSGALVRRTFSRGERLRALTDFYRNDPVAKQYWKEFRNELKEMKRRYGSLLNPSNKTFVD